MRKWWMCLNGKFFEEYMALLRTMTSGSVDIIENCTILSKSPDSQ
jgi:hypothetical protein